MKKALKDNNTVPTHRVVQLPREGVPRLGGLLRAERDGDGGLDRKIVGD
jgi:hypothetical protein